MDSTIVLFMLNLLHAMMDTRCIEILAIDSFESLIDILPADPVHVVRMHEMQDGSKESKKHFPQDTWKVPLDQALDRRRMDLKE